MSKEIVQATKKEIKTYDFNDPSSLINMAETLKTHIVKQGLYQKIGEKNYVEVEGWQFAGGLVGVYPIVKSVSKIDTEGKVFKYKGKYDKEEKTKEILKYEADVELFNKGSIVGKGIAICSNNEKGKENFDEYAVCSMAQTRATGKAYRLLLGWVMKCTGYEATPAEEMFEQNEEIIPSDINQKANEEIEKTKTDLLKTKDLEALRKYYSENSGKGKEVTKLITDKSEELKNLEQQQEEVIDLNPEDYPFPDEQ